MAGLETDSNGTIMQGFATARPLAVVGGVDATFVAGDKAFCVPQDCTYTIDGGIPMTLLAGAIRVRQVNLVYNFNTSMTLEVM